jgi:hypothetical protein
MSTTYPSTEARRAHTVSAGGGATESTGGVAVVVLAILSLVGVVPRVLLPIAGIVFGVAFMVEGAAVAARQSTLDGDGVALASTSVTVELFAGLATLILGILALIGIAIPVLMASLVIAGGGAMIISAGAVAPVMNAEANTRGVVVTTAVSSAASSHVLAGVAAVVLGILALTIPSAQANPMVSEILSSVALIVLGAALTFSGSAVSSAMVRLFQPRAS